MFAFQYDTTPAQSPPQLCIVAEKSFSIMLIPQTRPACLPKVSLLLFPFLGRKIFIRFYRFLAPGWATSSGVKQVPAFIHSQLKMMKPILLMIRAFDLVNIFLPDL